MADADPASEIVRDEVFGPVPAVMPFDTDDEAIDLANDPANDTANDPPYGLAASAWTRDVYRALPATGEIRAGRVWLNDHIPIISQMPHCGMKQSGFGKEDQALGLLMLFRNMRRPQDVITRKRGRVRAVQDTVRTRTMTLGAPDA